MWGCKLDLGRHKKGIFFLQGGEKEKRRRKGDLSARLERIGFAASHLSFLTLLS